MSLLAVFDTKAIIIAGKEIPTFVIIFLLGLTIFILAGLTYFIRKIVFNS